LQIRTSRGFEAGIYRAQVERKDFVAIVEILEVLDFLITDFDFDDTLSKLIDYADDPQFIINIQNMLKSINRRLDSG
jgi:hypothetical protein